MRAAARYYEGQREGFGDAFLNAIERATLFAVERPEAGTPIGDGFRWMLAQRFGYAVIYRQSPRGIDVVAVASLRRRPGYWRGR